MKIIIVGTAYPWRGGIAHYNALLASHLRKRHSVDVITFERQYPKILFPGKSQEEPDEVRGQRSEVRESAETIELKLAPQLIDSINPVNWFRVAREIRKRHPDLLIFKYWLPFFGPCFGTIAKRAKKGTKTKVLFICDNVIPHERRPGDVLFTKYALKQADFFIVQSDVVERDLRRFFPDAKYAKVPHPVYEFFGSALDKAVARETLGIKAKNVLLYFGYVRRYKGVMVLIEAMNELRAKKTVPDDTLLLIVGEFYDDETTYRRRVQELSLDSSIQFVADYVPNDKVALYFSAADVVVLPYLSATQSGIAQIAYNFDKPVIATNVGGLSEVVLDGKTGFIVPPNDPAALANTIVKFYKEEREKEFSENVKVEKKRYSWDHMVEAIERLVGRQ